MALDGRDLEQLLTGPWHGARGSVEPRPHQREALAAIMRAVAEGQRRVRIVMAPGTGLTAVVAECVKRLQLSGGARRALCVVDRRELAEEIRYMLDRSLIDTAVLEGAAPGTVPSVHVATFAYFTSRKGEHLDAIKPGFYDLVIVPELRDNVAVRRLLDRVQPPVVIGVSGDLSTSVPSGFDEPVFVYSFHEALSDAMAEPPEGYRAVCLGDIAVIQTRRRISVGAGVRTIEVPVITGADIARQWEFPAELGTSTEIPEAEVDQQCWIQPGDILIPAVQSGGSMHVGVIVPDDPPRAIVASTVIVVRITASDVAARSVLDFLESSLGRQALTMTGSRLNDYVRIGSLNQLVVHVPIAASTDAPPRNLEVARIRTQLVEHLLPRLESLAVESVDDERREHERRTIADALRAIATDLAPPPLSERVVNTFPTPISIAWRRYHDARFNPFEQVLRLRDLFEAAAFFTYNVVLLDTLRRLEPGAYSLPKAVRGAWRGASMASRLEFVETVLSHDGAPSDLFMAELASSDVVALGKRLQRELRNKISHSGAASESYQRRLNEEFYPIVHEMLEELSFLEHYRLARIPTISFRDGCPVQRMELWRGTVPVLVEHQLEPDAELPRIDSEHLVLLNIDNECLDLYPVYQLINNDNTGLQPQIFFVKQGKPGDDVFTIGSTYDATELEVPGAAALKRLEDEFCNHQS